MKTIDKDFENYKIAHYFLHSNEPLKKWINSENYINKYREDFESLIGIIDKIQNIITNKTSLKSFFNRTNHIIIQGDCLYIDTNIVGVYEEAVDFIKQL